MSCGIEMLYGDTEDDVRINFLFRNEKTFCKQVKPLTVRPEVFVSITNEKCLHILSRFICLRRN